MTADDLRAALRDGRSIADVAAERDVEVQTVIDAMVGAITENVEERVSQMVNHRRGSGERGREGATPPAEGTAA